MNGHEDWRAARQKVIRHVLALLLAEQSIADDPKAAATAVEEEAAVDLAARDLARAVTEMPVQDWPKGWDE